MKLLYCICLSFFAYEVFGATTNQTAEVKNLNVTSGAEKLDVSVGKQPVKNVTQTPLTADVIPSGGFGPEPDNTSPPTTPTTPTTTSPTTTSPTTPPTTPTTTSPTTPPTTSEKPTPTPKPTEPPHNSTTVAPPTTPTPSKTDRKFDGLSFFAGIILSAGLLAIGIVAFKFYEARRERNYHTL